MKEIPKQVLPENSLTDYDRDSSNVMTGMTFDEKGEPADYLKQVFASFETAEYLSEQGYDPEVQLLVADNFVKLNQGEDGLSDSEVDYLASKRADYLEAAAEAFSGDYNTEVVFSSEIKDSEYEQIVRDLGDQVEEDNEFADMLLDPVPDDKLDPDKSERELTKYTREELATIMKMGTDIKVGPEREKLYDLPARSERVRRFSEGAEPIIGVYVSDTLPTNLPEEELEMFRQKGGLTPYKAGSKGLNPEEHRVMIDDSESEISRKLAGAPGELKYDLASLDRFMQENSDRPLNTDLPSSLADGFAEITGRVSSR